MAEIKTGARAYTLLLVRVVVALIFITHAWPKLAEPSGTIGFFSRLGLPGCTRRRAIV